MGANRRFTKAHWAALNNLYDVAQQCGASVLLPRQGIYIMSSLPNYNSEYTYTNSIVPKNAVLFMTILGNAQYYIKADASIKNSMIDDRPCMSLEFSEIGDTIEYDFYTQVSMGIHDPSVQHTISVIDPDKFAVLIKRTIKRMRQLEQMVDRESILESQNMLSELLGQDHTPDDWPRQPLKNGFVQL